MKVCGAKKVVSTLTNSVNVTSGPPCLAVIKRKDASVTPSIGERPMMGFSIFCQKFILSVSQNTTTKHVSKWDRGLHLRQTWEPSEGFCPRSHTPSGGHFFFGLATSAHATGCAMHSTRSVQGCAKPAFPGYGTFSR